MTRLDLALHRINQRKRGQAAAVERSLQATRVQIDEIIQHIQQHGRGPLAPHEPVGPVVEPADRIDYWPVLPWAVGAGLACAFLVSRVWA